MACCECCDDFFLIGNNDEEDVGRHDGRDNGADVEKRGPIAEQLSQRPGTEYDQNKDAGSERSGVLAKGRSTQQVIGQPTPDEKGDAAGNRG